MKELNDDEIRIIGDDRKTPGRPSSRKWLIMLMMALVVGPNQQPVFSEMVFRPGLCSQLVKG